MKHARGSGAEFSREYITTVRNSSRKIKYRIPRFAVTRRDLPEPVVTPNLMRTPRRDGLQPMKHRIGTASALTGRPSQA